MQLLKSQEDWEAYKGSLDSTEDPLLKGRLFYKHAHLGRPVKFPCLVVSNFFDDPNGPYSYNHEFLYYEDVVELVNSVEEVI